MCHHMLPCIVMSLEYFRLLESVRFFVRFFSEIIIIILLIFEFYTSALADGFPPWPDRQQVS